MDSILQSWLESDYHKDLMSKYNDVCFIMLGGSRIGGYASKSTEQIADYDINYWTLESYDCDILSKYYYDEGDIHTHIDLYLKPFSCIFGESCMMGYFPIASWFNLSDDNVIWVNPKYKAIYDYCLSVKDKVSKAGMSVMLEREGDWIKSVYDGTLDVKQWNKNVYRLCGLGESLGVSVLDMTFLSKVKNYRTDLSSDDIIRARDEVKKLYEYMTENKVDWKIFKQEFVNKIDELKGECQ